MKVIKVIPRVDVVDGEPILFFPAQEYLGGKIECYVHVGQHSSASFEYYRHGTRPPREGECDALLREYENLGPESERIPLRVLHRMPRRTREVTP
jgi:hypothetical protein